MDHHMLYLLRHGEAAIPRPGELLGQRDLPLTDQGMARAAAWQPFFRRAGIGHVFCSDLCRTKAFAEHIADNARAVSAVPALREINLGAWDGLTRQEIMQRMPGRWEERGRALADFRPQGGESFSDLAARALPAFEGIAREAEGPALVVTHAGVIRVIVAHVLGMPLNHIFRLRVDYGALAVIAEDGGRRRLEGFNLPPGDDVCSGRHRRGDRVSLLLSRPFRY